MADREQIVNVLEDLLKLEDVKACLVAKKGLEGITPEKNEIDDIDLWKLIKQATDDFFKIVKKFYDYGLSSIYFEIEDYEVNITVLDEDTTLVVIFPTLTNKGLLEVEIENTRRELMDIFG